ncbi:unnamed protein product [Mytilus edulis]|uniref:Integrase core domain-containing protein n=1 Tax=Mytilus edulis TaxID=6550 RepID=A0A8S3RU40_MYTED|nr:unnamed protein product [Mytilus edulis]
MLMFMKCCDNNKSETVFDCFRTGISQYGTPNCVRSDKGLENILFADFMLGLNGSGSMITGPSIHNQRIERLWRDLFEGARCKNPVGAIPECDLQYYGVEGFDHSSLEQDGNRRPVFCPISETLWQRYRDTLRAAVPFPNTIKNHGIDDFIKCVNVISQNQQ